MNDLLELAVAAHGGQKRWQDLRRLSAHVAIGGAVWKLKGWPGAVADSHVDVDPHRQHVEYRPFLGADQYSVYEPHRTAIKAASGETVGQREAPRKSFEGHSLTTPWDTQHLVYFSGYAIWTYLTAPFLFKLPGFQTEEVEPWSEDGEVWRRLKVRFPSNVHSHSAEQVFYFDASGILRRHDYSVDIMGGTSSAHYAEEPKEFGGIIFPTKRRVYTRGTDNRPIRDRVAVAIEILSCEPA
jgi:hypothetical protein